jgi:diaminohydroxyphosphoribosylaminopyrimidine deaminase/5-amino-6-(5-phosphoribosylamino)uracil reductase
MSALLKPVAAVDPAVDLRFMDMALALGRRGLGNTWPNPAVGAVIVQPPGDGWGDWTVVGRGWTRPGGRPHAETEALARAGAAARGATLYATLEPCSHVGKTPPCADAIIAAGIARVVSPLDDPNPEVAGRGHQRLRANGVAVTVGVGAEVARRDHAGHLRRIADGRPHVLLKLAVSADGKAGLAGRRPVAITGEAARARSHMLRATSDAILIGIGTALADDPALTCRLPGMIERSPVRVVLDSMLRLPLDGQLAETAADIPVWVFAAVDAPAERERALRQRGIEVLRVGGDKNGRLDLDAVLRLLATMGITRLMVEGGPTLAGVFAAADLVDEACIFRAARVIGADGIDALDERAWQALATHLEPDGAAEIVGADRLETYRRR